MEVFSLTSEFNGKGCRKGINPYPPVGFEQVNFGGVATRFSDDLVAPLSAVLGVVLPNHDLAIFGLYK